MPKLGEYFTAILYSALVKFQYLRRFRRGKILVIALLAMQSAWFIDKRLLTFATKKQISMHPDIWIDDDSDSIKLPVTGRSRSQTANKGTLVDASTIPRKIAFWTDKCKSESISLAIVEITLKCTVDRSDEFCSRMFGNGYTEQLFAGQSMDCTSGASFNLDSRLQCWQHNAIHSTLCHAYGLRIDRNKIKVSAGGEPIETVRGRQEEDEMPRYSRGALSLANITASGQQDQTNCRLKDGENIGRLANQNIMPHHLYDMFRSFQQPTEEPDICDRWMSGLTLLITRFEYANLYHTMTDWQLAHQMRSWFTTGGPLNIIFMDGHSAGALDEAWELLFAIKPLYLSQLPRRTCFENAVLVPAGYSSPLSVGFMSEPARSCARPAALVAFIEAFLKGAGISPLITETNSQPRKPTVLFIFRKDYLAHPRVVGVPKVTRKIINERELVDGAKIRFGSDVNVEEVSFETISIKEQLQAIRRATVVISIHGAGLSHILFADSGTTLIEIMPPAYSSRYHFEYFSTYAGANYVKFNIEGQAGPDDSYIAPVERLLTEIAARIKPEP